MTSDSQSTLEITIESSSFTQDMNYFITINIDNNQEKRRTDISNKSKSPSFKSNKFYLPLKQYNLVINEKIIFAAFVVIDSSDSTNEPKGQAKLLGEAILDLSPITKDLNSIHDVPVNQRLEFMRRQGENNAIVGKLNITLKLIENNIETLNENNETTVNDGMRLLPEMDVIKNFIWRIRIDVRSAINLPFNHTSSDRLPSCYVEMGWTMYAHKELNLSDIVRSAIIESNRFPIWNHQLLYYPPSSVQSFEGFFNIYLKDKYQSKPIQKIVFPVNCLRPYHPVHLDFLLETEDNYNRSHLFLSVVIEDCPEYKLSDSLVNIIIHNINFDPFPKSTNRMSIMMTTEKLKPDNVKYIEIEMKSESHLINSLIAFKTDPYSYFMTNTLPIPINKAIMQNQFGAIANFIIPRSYLDKKLSFFLLVRDKNVISNHSMPNTIAGFIDIVTEDLLKTSFYSKLHDIVRYKIIWYKETMIYPSLCHSRCDSEFSVRPVEDISEKENKIDSDIDYDKIKNNMIKNTIDEFTVNLPKVPDKDKWDIISKEMSQKQELIHRLIVEIDDKKESLKKTGEEIIDQRKKIRMLQNENSILKKRLGQEEMLQVESLVTSEIHKMSLPELKSKIIKLSQNYRNERIKNEEYEKMLNNAQSEIANARKLGQELEELQKQHELDMEKYLGLQRETQKMSLYRETITKQEEVISKTEEILKKKLTEIERLKRGEMEIEQLRTENMKLQKELKDLVINSNPGLLGKVNPEVDKLKGEIRRLENVIKDLQEELKLKRPVSAEKHEIQSNILDLEVKLHKANARVASLEDELRENSIRYAQEISRLKMILSEKESIIESLRIENAI